MPKDRLELLREVVRARFSAMPFGPRLVFVTLYLVILGAGLFLIVRSFMPWQALRAG